MGGKTYSFFVKSEQPKRETEENMTSIQTDNNSIKTRYIRSRKNPDQVMTLVTKIDGDTLTFAVAINSPPRKHALDRTGQVVWGRTGDTFSRKTGSSIALGRLGCERSRRVVKFNQDEQHPLQVALSTLSSPEEQKKNPLAARIASAHMADLVSSLLRSKKTPNKPNGNYEHDHALVILKLKEAKKAAKKATPEKTPSKKVASKKTAPKKVTKVNSEEKRKLNHALTKALSKKSK